ncbi:hypothetical protein FH972_023876 [Carpinus fangiana]|uniref:6-phosphogluconate dehydrogenase NADP-binding domain-containing protein n=1 Tax=Carpinus fangiana TaxID=176857 RepID=A0A5N6KX75_9ROSI|nr:hypothetical protein FH972_023876 [Carpinus fangiana]
MAPQLAWIGLGNMGRGMCKNLVEKGNLSQPLLIYNRTTKRAEDLSAKLLEGKSKVANTIAEAVKPSDIIFSCVGRDADITETLDACLAAGDVTGKLFVDCSTIHPDTSNELSKKMIAAGAYFVASPVFGAPAMADAGQLIFVMAGPTEQIERVKPFTKGVMGRQDIEFGGQEPGKALLLKVIGNTFVLNMVEMLSEGHVIAEKTGLGSDNLHKFIEALFPGPYTAYSNRMMSGDYHKREEDAGHALNLAESSGAKMPAVEVAQKHLQDVKDHSKEKGDIAGIYGAVRQDGGLKFEN